MTGKSFQTKVQLKALKKSGVNTNYLSLVGNEIDKYVSIETENGEIFSSVNNCDVIVVIGGDGFMLKTLKKFQNYNKPFYGMNRGTFGFLMNKFNIKNIYKSILLSKSLSITALEMIARTKNNIKKTAIAINEVSLLREGRQAASLKVIKNKKVLIKKLIC